MQNVWPANIWPWFLDLKATSLYGLECWYIETPVRCPSQWKFIVKLIDIIYLCTSDRWFKTWRYPVCTFVYLLLLTFISLSLKHQKTKLNKPFVSLILSEISFWTKCDFSYVDTYVPPPKQNKTNEPRKTQNIVYKLIDSKLTVLCALEWLIYLW